MILLDTHAWIWLSSDPTRLGPQVREAPPGSLALSTISAWEVATKAAQQKLTLDRPVVEWVSAAHRNHEIRSEAVSLSIAVRAGSLGAEGFHGDPADRIIVATALILGCPLATVDDKIRAWADERNVLPIVW